MKHLLSFGFVPQSNINSSRKTDSSGGRNKQFESIQPELHAMPEPGADQPLLLPGLASV